MSVNAQALAEADDLVREGVRLESQRRRGEAAERFRAALQRAPEHPFALLHLAASLAGEGRFDEAGPPLTRALELRPQSAAFHLFAGRIRFDAGQWPAAQEELRRTLELNAENDIARAYGTLTAWAAGDLSAPERLDPANLPDSNAFLARLLMQVELEMKGCSAEYVEPGRPTPLLDRPRVAYMLWRAAMARKRGDTAKAEEWAAMIGEMHPGHPAAMALLSECRQAGLEQARRRAEESPTSGEVRLELAWRLTDAERYAEAQTELAEARRLLASGGGAEPLSLVARFVLGIVSGIERLCSGEKAAKENATSEPPEVLRLAGRLACMQGRYEEAETLLRAGTEPGFSMVETHYYLGLALLGRGRRMECLAEFEGLVAQAGWAVPIRLREYLAWRRGPEAGTRT